MAGIVKRVAAVLVSIVWLSLILVLLAGFFLPNLHEFLPTQVREFTDPEALRERWESFTDSLVTGIGFQPPAELEATETPTPDPALSTSPTATPVPETPTAALPTAESATPATPPSMSSDGDEKPPEIEKSVSISVSEAGQADLRSAPNEDADVIGLVAAGGTIIVNGRDPTGRWYRLEDGTWIDADDLADAPQDQVPVVMVETQQPPPSPGESPTSETPPTQPSTQLVAVNADANLRSGPGIEYDRVDGVNFGEEVSIVGISADGEWYLLESGVWLFAALAVEAVDVPVVTEDTDSDLLTTTETGQPETEQPETEQPDTGDEQTEAGTEQTETEQTETETDAEQPQPVVNAPLGANLRAGSGVEFDRVDGVEQGQVLTIVAQDTGGAWLKLEDGSWIFAALVDNVPADLPVESGEATEAETDDSGADEETSDETPPPADEAEQDADDTHSTQPPDSSDDEQDEQTGDDEQDTQTGDDEQDEQTGDDEQDTQTGDDEQDEQTGDDEQDTQTGDDEQNEQTGEDDQSDEDEQDTQDESVPVVLATVNTDANLRNGPGLEATIVDSAPVGTQVTVVGRSDDDQWLELDNGFWIFANLVDILPAEEEEDADDDTGTDDTDEGQVAHPQVIASDLYV